MKFSTVLRTTAALSLATTSHSNNFGFAGQVYNEEEFRQFESMSTGDRILVVTKNSWPECVHSSFYLSKAENCKRHIERELAGMGLKEPIETVIIYSRREDSPTSNAIVIPLDENNMVAGKHGDGRLFYDFDWEIEKREVLTDEEAITNSRKLIQPSKWTKMVAANKNVDCTDVDADGDLEVWHNKSLQVMGGDFEVACSTPEGVSKLQAAKSAGPVVDVGHNNIPPIDAAGLSGVDACKMIKEHMIPYPNSQGKNIECWLSYHRESPKQAEINKAIEENSPVAPKTIVRIYATKNSHRVWKIPQINGPRSAIGSE